jgi:hypothetical protein
MPDVVLCTLSHDIRHPCFRHEEYLKLKAWTPHQVRGDGESDGESVAPI